MAAKTNEPATVPDTGTTAQIEQMRATIDTGAGGDLPPAHRNSPPRRIFVWDLPLRFFHWSLVGLVATAWWTGGSGEELHEIAGYLIATLITFRLGWGLLGTRHARFSDFLASPVSVLRYMRSLATGKAERHLGHNPPGGMMIIALLACLTTVCVTGIMQMTATFFGVSWVEDLHIWAANGILLLVPMHVLGVVVSSLLHRENLVGAMITGEKAALEGELDTSPRAVEETLLQRIHASHGFVVLGLMLAGGLAYGLEATSGRELTIIAPPAPNAPPSSGGALTAAPTATAPTAPAAIVAAPETARLTIPQRKPQRPEPQQGDHAPAAPSIAANDSTTQTAEIRRATPETPRPEAIVEPVTWHTAALQRSLRSQQLTAARRPEDPSQVWRLGRGGRIYADWSAELALVEPEAEAEPAAVPSVVPGLIQNAAAQPARPASNYHPAAASPGCASCHGWSYDGATSGRTKQGSLSLRNQRGRNPDAIVRALSKHVAELTNGNFGDPDLEHLALFISKGQHEIARYISPANRALGDKRRGEGLYQSVCASCHGYGGTLVIPQTNSSGGLGEVAKQEAARVFHLIRNGHPGLPVAAMRAFPISDSADLLTYLQSLPAR